MWEEAGVRWQEWDQSFCAIRWEDIRGKAVLQGENDGTHSGFAEFEVFLRHPNVDDG